MKKAISLLLVLTMIFSLAACSKNTENTPVSPSEPTVPVISEDSSPALKLYADFVEKMISGEYASMEALANALITNDIIPFSGAVMSVEPGFLNGFTKEIEGFSDGAVFAPMIGSIPFIGYVFQLENSADVDAFVSSLKDASDLRWNICTQADEMLCDSFGNTIFFVMSPSDLNA